MLTKARSVFPSKQMGGDHLDNQMANHFLAAKKHNGSNNSQGAMYY